MGMLRITSELSLIQTAAFADEDQQGVRRSRSPLCWLGARRYTQSLLGVSKALHRRLQRAGQRARGDLEVDLTVRWEEYRASA